MLTLKGKYNTAKVYTDIIEETAIGQIIELCNQEFVKDSNIAIMPDVHAGKGCTIGTTMTLHGKVVPNLVGVDIGCGMFTIKLKNKEVNFENLDFNIKQNIPSGQSIRKKAHDYLKYVAIEKLRCKEHVNLERAELSLGTLGGGNHFIEMNKDSEGNLYLVIHSGSRNLGKQIAEYYQKKAIEYHENIKSGIQKELCYLEGQDYEDYMHDMNIVQQYALMNREAMADVILNKMEFDEDSSFHTIHNYIEESDVLDDNGYAIEKEYMLRKGAIRATKGETVLIPINMRDGSILGRGKGNPEWNNSAPHGAGRVLSRAKAKEQVELEDFKNAMDGIYSTSVCQSTLDESPFAYKTIESILSNIGDSVEVIDILKPVYNYKAH